jgi:diguanylate cyclase (GGDEF)-like protein
VSSDESRSRLRRRLGDAVLTTDPVRRLRLAQAGLAMLIMALGVLAMHYFVVIGRAPAGPVLAWSSVTVGGMVVFFALIRSGWSQRVGDASLTLPQMVFALASAAVAYALVGAGRGAVFPVVMVVLAFGIFRLRPAQVWGVCLYAVVLFGAVMALMAWRRPEVFVPAVELGHFIMIATMMPAMAVVAERLGRLRALLRQQKQELARALAHIQQLATHDDLTGLVNQRHMQDLLRQESQRCVRSGQSFCFALLDIDHFKEFNARHGTGAADEALRRGADALKAAQRGADVLARWGGDTFAVLLTDTRVGLARVGVDRMRERLAAPANGLPVLTVSAGVAEHLAGEPLERTVQRAADALRQAKEQGRNRVMAA